MFPNDWCDWFFLVVSPWPWRVFSQVCPDLYWTDDQRRTLLRYLKPSLFMCSSLFSTHLPLGILLTLASMNSEYCLFFAERLLALFKYSFPVLQPGNSLHAVNWGYCRIYLIHFPFPRDNYPLLPDAQCPRNCIYIYIMYTHTHIWLKKEIEETWMLYSYRGTNRVSLSKIKEHFSRFVLVDIKK